MFYMVVFLYQKYITLLLGNQYIFKSYHHVWGEYNSTWHLIFIKNTVYGDFKRLGSLN